MKKKRFNAYLILLFVSVLWGIATPVIKNTLNYYSPTIFLTYRFFLSSLIALLYFTFNPSTLPKTRSTIYHSLVHSVCVVILGLGILFIGVNYTDSLTGALLSATGPIFSIFLGTWLLKEHISRHEMVGLGMALVGSLLTVVTGDGALKFGFLGVAMLGNVLILISRIADSYGSVSTKQAINEGMTASSLAHISFFIGFLFFAVISVLQLGSISLVTKTILAAPLSAHLGVFYMAFLSGTLGYTLANKALKEVDLGEASMFTYLTVVWAAPVSILWLHDKLTPQFIIGGCLIAVGVLIAEWHRKKRKKNGEKRKKR